jgi:hypothetical protein
MIPDYLPDSVGLLPDPRLDTLGKTAHLPRMQVRYRASKLFAIWHFKG